MACGARQRISDVQIGVLKPIARTTHQPVRASNRAKAPPTIEPSGSSQRAFGPAPTRSREMARKTPVTTPSIPSLNLTALPRASILHSKTMYRAINLRIKRPVSDLELVNIAKTDYCEAEIDSL